MSDSFRRYRILWPDQFGLARGRYQPASAATGGTWFSSAVFMQSYDRNLYSVEAGLRPGGLPDLQARFLLDNARPGWEPDTGIVVADLYYGTEPYPISPRYALRAAVARWREQEMRALLGATVSGYILRPGTDGWEPLPTPSSYLYGTGASADPTGLLYEIMATADSCGLAVESVCADLDGAQFEITLPLADALQTVDTLFLLREMARELANERDLKITFLPKPAADRGGSGMHLALALFDQTSNNILFDGDAPDGLSTGLRSVMAGVLDHHEALAALAGPTVNSYKRFRGGDIIGTRPTWGYDHRFATIRVPPLRGRATHLQYRLADAAANPYLVAAGLLHAAALGHRARANPGTSLNDRRDGDGDDGRTVPATLDAAVAALRADEELVTALDPRLVENFCQLKLIEWNNFIDTETRWADRLDEVSEWETATYLPFH